MPYPSWLHSTGLVLRPSWVPNRQDVAVHSLSVVGFHEAVIPMGFGVDALLVVAYSKFENRHRKGMPS